MQNSKYICDFSKKVAISFERGDIDVRTSHAKPPLFLLLFRMYNVLGTLFFVKNDWKTADHNFGTLPNTLRNAWYLVHFSKK